MTAKQYKIHNNEIYRDNEKLSLEEICDTLNNHEVSRLITIANKHKTELNHIKHTIKTSYETERTQIGKNTLKQLMEAIE